MNSQIEDALDSSNSDKVMLVVSAVAGAVSGQWIAQVFTYVRYWSPRMLHYPYSCGFCLDGYIGFYELQCLLSIDEGEAEGRLLLSCLIPVLFLIIKDLDMKMILKSIG